MNTEIQENKKTDYVAYEYLSVHVKDDLEPIYTDCYENLGWQSTYNSNNEKVEIRHGSYKMVNLKFKRDRKIKNRSMLLSLQKKCETALIRINKYEKSKESRAIVLSMITGIAGFSLLTGAVFGFLAGKMALVVISSLFGVTGCGLSYFVYKKIRINQEAKVAPLIEEQYDLVYNACGQAKNLLA